MNSLYITKENTYFIKTVPCLMDNKSVFIEITPITPVNDNYISYASLKVSSKIERKALRKIAKRMVKAIEQS